MDKIKRKITYYFSYIKRKIYSMDEWFVFRTDCTCVPTMDTPLLPDGFNLIDQNEIQIIRYAKNTKRNQRLEERIKDKKYIGMGVISSAQLCYDTWIHIGAYIDPNTGIKVGEGENIGVFLDSWTEPEYRRAGLHRAMVGIRICLGNRLGLNSLYGLVYSQNIGSIKAHRYYGAILVSKIKLTKIFDTRIRQEVRYIESITWDD